MNVRDNEKCINRIKSDVLNVFKRMKVEIGDELFKDNCMAYMEHVLNKKGYQTSLHEYLDICRFGFTMPVIIKFDLVIENKLMVKFIDSELEEKNLSACMNNLLRLSELKGACLVKIENISREHKMSFY